MKAVISGATRGIGRAIAVQLAKEKYDLVLIARNEVELIALAEQLALLGSKAQYIALDLSKKSSFEKLATAKDQLKGISIIVNNLGVYSTQEADHIAIDLLQTQLETNLYSAIQLTQTILSTEMNVKRIINIGSVMSINASHFATDYSISKHAFKAWNDGMREKLRSKGVKVSAIYPGAVNTSSWDGVNATRSAMIQPEDIAKAVSYILSLSENALVEEIRISPQNFGQ